MDPRGKLESQLHKGCGSAIVRCMGETEADPSEEKALFQLRALIDFVSRLREDEPLEDPVPGSRLHDVDSALGGFPITHNIERNLGVSVDHLHALALLVGKAKAIVPYAGFSMLRASLETVAQGMWLLSGGSRAEMIARNVRVEWLNNQNRRTAYRAVGRSTTDIDQRFEKLRVIAETLGETQLQLDRHRVPLTSSEMVRGAAEALDLYPAMLTAWQGTSGIAHGRSWAMLGLSDRVEIPGTRNKRGAKFMMTSNTQTLVGFYFIAVAAHTVLRRCFEAALAGRTDMKHPISVAVLAELWVALRMDRDQ